jgi:hypothetical protein
VYFVPFVFNRFYFRLVQIKVYREIDKQKRARDDEGAFKAHHRKGLWTGVIIVADGKSDSHARIIQQEFYCAKLNEKLQGPVTE